MKQIPLLLFLPLASFSQTKLDSSFKIFAEYQDLFLFSKNHFIGNAKLDTSYYPNSKHIKAIGSYVVDTHSNVSHFKYGPWKEYYPDGKLKSQGVYEFCSVYSCCSASLCMLYYSHKVDEWTYFYQSGQLKAKGKYKIELVPEGRINGETIKRSTIDATWTLLDEQNNQLKPEGNIKIELEEDH